MEVKKDLQHFLKHSISSNSCDEIAGICQDFFKETGLTYYNYVRVYHDGSRISLANNREWLTYVLKHHSKYKLITEEIAPKGGSRYVIWDNDKNHQNDPLFIFAREKYNIAHGLTITTTYKGYIEIQYFGTGKNNDSVNNFYINNLSLFSRFGAFFREKASHIIRSAEKEKLLLPGRKMFWLKKDIKTGKIKYPKKIQMLCESKEVGKICEDFFKETGLTYYNYVRVYHDGSRISLTNNKEWALYVFTNHSKHQLIAEVIPLQGYSRYIVWDNDENHQKDSLLTIARKEYDIDHGFTIITAYEGYVEFQYFASVKKNKAINHFYINNLDILNSFGAFFREKGIKLIQSAEKEKVIFPGHKIFWLEKDDKTGELKRNLHFKALREYEVSRYYLSGKHSNIYLTKREAQCLTALIDGLTAKETARLLEISHKTVRIYLESVKQKLGCQKRSELVNKANESGFRSIYVAVHALYFRHLQKPSEDLGKPYFLP